MMAHHRLFVLADAFKVPWRLAVCASQPAVPAAARLEGLLDRTGLCTSATAGEQCHGHRPGPHAAAALMLTSPCLQSIFSGEAATEAAAQHEQGEQDLLAPLDIMP